jgi:antitoxin MazE
MQVVIKKRGYTATVQIPMAIMKAAKLTVGDPVEVRKEHGRIIIESVSRNRFDLSQLLAGITPENLHFEVDFGPATGKEAM